MARRRRGVIGYYAHHHGSGHVHRAMAIAAQLHDDVTILSSAPRPREWRGSWIDLPLDTDADRIEADAHGALHWAPLGSEGLATRMHLISEWLMAATPDVVVVDVSVEVTMLVRLHGIRVIVVAQPGDRTDRPHSLAYGVADGIIGCWPASISPLRADESTLARLEAVGGLSRVAESPTEVVRRRQIAVITGTGGRGSSSLAGIVDSARLSLPDFEWVTLRNEGVDVVTKTLRESALVFAHCGANTIAEIAASRTPAVLVPEARPFDEQEAVAMALSTTVLPLRVVRPGDAVDWRPLANSLQARTTDAWEGWVDGHAAERAALVINRVAALTVGVAA